jgi:hypothetical protein
MTSKPLPLRLSLSKPGLQVYRHSRSVADSENEPPGGNLTACDGNGYQSVTHVSERVRISRKPPIGSDAAVRKLTRKLYCRQRLNPIGGVEGALAEMNEEPATVFVRRERELALPRAASSGHERSQPDRVQPLLPGKDIDAL